MDIGFEELDYRRTALGELVLRRRTEPKLGVEVLEVKLGEEFLMSSLFTVGEVELASLALARLGPGPLDVVVGGLGLGYTAGAVLDHGSLRSLVVIEALEPVIEWHRSGKVPLGPKLCADARCTLLQGDFFALARSQALDGRNAGRRFDAVLVDIDHSPRHLLSSSSASFYGTRGLSQLATHLAAGGVFGLWSNDPPDPGLEQEMGQAFARVETHVVKFHNPLQDREASCSLYFGFAGV